MGTGDVSLFIAVIAVIVSLYAARTSTRAHREKLTDEAVLALYGQFELLSDLRLTYWQVSHLFEVPENYDDTCVAVKRAVGTASTQDKARYYLMETATALRIFSFFEQVLYQQAAAKRHGDKGRQHFFQEVLDYFTDHWLRNPRMLYLWESGLHHKFEAETVHYINVKIRSGPAGAALPRDARGPVG